MAFTPYTWIFALSVVVSFIESYGIGANDLANAFGTSVGSKAVKYWQAVLIASIFEFLGAVLLGANNTETMKAGVADPKAFAERPEILMYGMLCVMIAAAFWDIFSCTLELQVSTTHTTAGALMGMALASYGSDAVIWSQSTTKFPYVRGVSSLFIGWGTSPVLASISAATLYFLTRTFVLRSKNAYNRSLYVLPLCVWLASFVISFTVIQTGNKNKTWDAVSNTTSTWVSIVVGTGCAIFSGVVFIPIIKRHVAALEAEREAASAVEEGSSSDDGTGAKSGKLSIEGSIKKSESNNALTRSLSRTASAIKESKAGQAIARNRVFKWITYGLTYDIHQVLDESNEKYNEKAVAIHANAEVFDYRVEAVFKYVQVFTACVMSFAHGANDVANAMGPFAAGYYVWRNAEVPGKSVPVDTWILAYGGVGIVIGLATYGWHIMGLFGVKSVKITNTRGYCIELATAMTVILAARFGIPVSTSHICVFAAVAVGCFEGWRGVNWIMVLQTFAAMIITLGTSLGCSAGLTAFGVYSPMKNLDDATGYPGGQWQIPSDE